MLIFLSFIAIGTIEAVENQTQAPKPCNAIERLTIFKQEFNINQGVHPYDWLCYISEVECTGFMIEHGIAGILMITSAHCLLGRNADATTSVVPRNMVCPVHGPVRLTPNTFIFHPDWLAARNAGVDDHDYDLAAFVDHTLVVPPPKGFTINSPGLELSKPVIMGFAGDDTTNIRVAPIEDVAYVSQRRHITYHTNAQWGDCIVTGSPITHFDAINGRWHVIAVNQDEEVSIDDTLGNPLLVDCYQYGTKCHEGPDGYTPPYNPYGGYELLENEYGNYGDGGYGGDGGSGTCPEIIKCEFFASTVDTKLIKWKSNERGFGWGDPHFVTLDGRKFNIYNNCQYYLLWVDQLRISGQFGTIRWTVPQIKSLLFEYSTNRVLLGQNGRFAFYFRRPNRIWYEFKPQSFPFKAKYFTIIKNGPASYTVEVANGIKVTWGDAYKGLPSIWDIEIPNSLEGSTIGLLGNFNGDPNDDCALPNQQVVSCPQNFAPLEDAYLKAWRVPGSSCSNTADIFDEDVADTIDYQTFKDGTTACAVINAHPFGDRLDDCFNKTVRDKWVADCVEDYDSAKDDSIRTQSVCDSLQVIASECRNYVPDVVNFRETVAICPVPDCPSGQHFDPCINQCDLQCLTFNRLSPAQCGSSCIGACACDNKEQRLTTINTCSTC